MLPVDYKILSPIGTNVFPCFGAHYLQAPKQKKPYAYALRVGIKKTEGVLDMLVKIPLSAHQKETAKSLFEHLTNGSIPVTVAFENIQCYQHNFDGKIIISATADSFKIQED